MKKAMVVLVLVMLLFSSCAANNQRRIVGTWTDIEGITWVFSADGKLEYENTGDDNSREYRYSVFDGEWGAELTIFAVEYSMLIAYGLADQKYMMEYSKDGKTLRLTGAKDLYGWSVAGPGWGTNQLSRK